MECCYEVNTNVILPFTDCSFMQCYLPWVGFQRFFVTLKLLPPQDQMDGNAKDLLDVVKREKVGFQP